MCLYCEPKTCDNKTGICERCLTGFYGEKCEETCPNTCLTCEKSNGRCLSCIDGWFGENCNFECVHCFSCHKESGACTSCQPNFWGPQCQNECEHSCHVCNIDNGECIHCGQGYFGDNCTKQCGHCRRGFCDRPTGTCQFGCNDGFYGNSCEKSCPQNCMVCNQTDGECLMCRPKLWGSQCDYTCPLNCDYCDVTTGECLECVEGYHGDKCQETCGRCAGQICEKDTGYCEYGCEDGWFGGNCKQMCNQNCSKCTTKDECMVCIPGLAGSSCDIKCPEICTACSQDMISGEIVCSECASGFTQPQKNCSCTMSKCTKRPRSAQIWGGNRCEECEADSGWYLSQGSCCPCKHCAGGNQFCASNGTCLNGCEPHYYPKDQGCDVFCDLEHCIWCEPFFGYGKVCVGCETGYFLENDGFCYSCSEHCKGGSTKCHTTTGSCVDGCKDGWFGDRCDSTCHDEHCAECDNIGNTCLTCMDGYYGEHCLKHCPTNCTKCSRDTGFCLECEKGRFSESCTKTCPNCLNKECDISGKCSYGCKEGWFGTHCDKKCMEGCSKCSELETCDECYIEAALLNGKCYSPCSRCIHQKCTTNGACKLGCVDGWHGEKCDRPCLMECSKCTSNDSCTSCLRGFKWEGNRCVSTCENCVEQQCSADGLCDKGCKEGWFGKKCIEKCVEGCISCSDGFNCERCLSGYQLSGNKCIIGCNFCIEEDCDLQGNCRLGCKDGYFGSQCKNSCMKGCQVCDSVESCTVCSHGFHLINNKCEASCTNCVGKVCDVNDVCSSGCVGGWFGKRCDQKCNDNCATCNSNVCLKCNIGYDLKDGRCIKVCGNCVNTECNTNKDCELGCNCKKCGASTNGIPRCTECQQPHKIPEKMCSCTDNMCIKFSGILDRQECKQCSKDWYVHSGTCCPCSHCRDGSCNSTGYCQHGCEDGWYPINAGCDLPCGENCISCKQGSMPNVPFCTRCKEGYHAKYGACQKCSSTCKNNACEESTAQCLEGCVEGWTDLLCNVPKDGTKIPTTECEGSCLTCNSATKQCSSCIAGMWGKNCHQKCPSECNGCDQQTGQCMVVCSKYCNKNANSLSCHNITGACLQGCEDGWYGDQCQNRCSPNCVEGVCERTFGHCVKGCAPGWKGSTCIGKSILIHVLKRSDTAVTIEVDLIRNKCHLWKYLRRTS